MTGRTNTTPRPPGRSINRRQALAGLGGLGFSALLAACGQDSRSPTATAASTGTSAAMSTGSAAAALLAGAGSCAVVPELTEGPYYLDIDKSAATSGRIARARR